jgi:hypothetical protein
LSLTPELGKRGPFSEAFNWPSRLIRSQLALTQSNNIKLNWKCPTIVLIVKLSLQAITILLPVKGHIFEALCWNNINILLEYIRKKQLECLKLIVHTVFNH